MNKFLMTAIPAGILLGTSSLSAAHGGSHAELAPLHFLTSLDHMSIFALVAAGAVALTTRLTISHLRKAPTRNQ